MTTPSSQPVLYVVATPIGNLGDISHRALEVLRAVRTIYAEDTRRTRALLSHFAIVGKDVYPLHAHSEAGELERALATLSTHSVAMVTDAGTPAVSDPGSALVRRAIEAHVPVVPLPGPSAVLAALVGSGLAGDAGFRFVGFLPRDGTARSERIALAIATPEPVILFEASNRTAQTLGELAELAPERPACVARELTKLHEEFVRGSLLELAAPREWLGEVAIVLGAAPARSTDVSAEALDARIDEELARGTHARSIAERLAAWSGKPRRDVYQRVIERKPRG